MTTTPEVATALATKLHSFLQTLTPPETAAFLELLEGTAADVAGHLSTTSVFSLSVVSFSVSTNEGSAASVGELATALDGDPARCRLWVTLPDGQRLCVLYGD